MPVTSSQDLSQPANLLPMFFDSFILARAISVAARLGIADLLTSDAKSADELARATGVHAQSLYRVLRALAGAGIFAEDEAGRFHLTPLAEQLRSDAPNSWRGFANFLGSDFAYQAYGDLLYSVQTGQPAFNHALGKSVREYLGENPEQARIFDEGMTSTSQQSAPAILAVYDFSGIKKLVDVGGGQGFMIASILKAYPQMNGVLFDLPNVVAGAAPILEAQGVSDRCACIGGNFLESVPEGGDLYFMQAILHGMKDEQCIQLLQNVRESMHENGTLLQVDFVIPSGNVPSTSKFGDLHMMIFTPSHERTEAEYRALYEQAGFRLTRVSQTSALTTILEGKRS